MYKKLLIFLALITLLSLSANAELMQIPFNHTPPYRMFWNEGASSDALELFPNNGPKAPGNLWSYQHFASGGFDNRPFVRYYWWDWDISGVGQGSDQAGWYEAGSKFRPADGWTQGGPYYLRFRIRINAALLQHSDPVCDDTQMKFFIWNSFLPDNLGGGSARAIMMLDGGSNGGGNDLTHTRLKLSAGVTASYASTLIPNGEWVNVQLAMRGGPEGIGYQRIYVNNNNEAIPTAQNIEFNDVDNDPTTTSDDDNWMFAHPTGLDSQIFWGGITNTGSCVREDAEIDVMDVQIDDEFDPDWNSQASINTTHQGPLVRIPFNSTPYQMYWSNGSRPLVEMSGRGACAPSTFWNFMHSPGGGWNNLPYTEWRWCDIDVTGIDYGSSGWTESGFRFRPASGWPADTFFGRLRLYVDTPITADPGGDTTRQYKFFMWHASVYDGDQRVIGFLESGSNCGQSDSTHVCFTLQRNIYHTTDTATVAVPIDSWQHLQWSWKHGAAGTSYLKVWLNNNNEAAPSAQDTNLNPCSMQCPSQPGGTSDWVKANAGYDGQFYIGDSANTGTEVDEDFVVRLMHFELGSSFDPSWHSQGTTPQDTTAPSQVTGLSATAASQSAITLAWNTATDNAGVAGYSIYRNNVNIANVTSTSYSSTGLSAGTSYSFHVRAFDAAGNLGQPSMSASATTQAAQQSGFPQPFDTTAAYTTTRYISPTGSDTNGDGSQNAPFASIGRALQNRAPGLRIIMLPGRYIQQGTHLNVQGTATNPIAIIGQGDVTIDASAGSAGIGFSDPQYLVLENFAVENSPVHGMNLDDGGTYATPGRHVVIRNIRFRQIGSGNNNDCLKLSGIDNVYVTGSNFTSCNAGEAIDMVGCHDGIITGNTFHGISASAVQAKGGSSNMLIHGNRFTNVAHHAIVLGGSTGDEHVRPLNAPYEGERIQAMSNVVENTGFAPFNIQGCNECLVSGNTVVTPGRWIVRILQGSRDTSIVWSRNGYFINNIIYYRRANLSATVNVGPNTEPATFQFGNNLYYSTDGNAFNGVHGGSVPNEVNSVLQQNPLFINTVEYRVQATSPASGAGRPLPYGQMFHLDFASPGSPPDIGAYRVSGSFSALEGDVNSDRAVNILDIQSIISHWGKISSFPANVDLASIGIIDLFDVMVVVRNWGRSG